MLQIELLISEAARDKVAPAELEGLYQRAQEAMRQAYAPYSRFTVGAALLSEDDSVITAANMENASYGLTICAERIAAGRAVSEGHRRFRAIAVAIAGEDGASSAGPCCGACLQVLSEFSPSGDLVVAYPEGDVLRVVCLSELLPVRFSL